MVTTLHSHLVTVQSASAASLVPNKSPDQAAYFSTERVAHAPSLLLPPTIAIANWHCALNPAIHWYSEAL